jgi:hypothetical protein
MIGMIELTGKRMIYGAFPKLTRPAIVAPYFAVICGRAFLLFSSPIGYVSICIYFRYAVLGRAPLNRTTL